ncbi:TIGR03936 family radical SAM-associated protein [Clostridium sp. OS1-26]|uniref:TIGR03936 family radical SAM-associated protein n=1 Tax=Clostridium sp. OS1-26 TaxID=3070681 RepID=UPI0027DF7745|nr:TIGR03936 family radical SAM-associated protein [Clostridium sp. OS1-26]WML35687.1 TIGR03936 family radical SAM-associated protein [Clostridium sp. OS1-26]
MRVRYLIKFSKEDSIKFVAHLDLMRTIQRMMKRSGLPVQYSKGFNPHINMSLAQPLAVGVYSSGDYLDAAFDEELDESTIVEKLNLSAPMGIKVFEAVKIKEEQNKKVFKSMAAIDAAKYTIKVKYNSVEFLNQDMEKLLNAQQWETIKKSKSGESKVNIKSMIKEIKYEIVDNILIIHTTVSCGSRENLSSELLAKFIQENTREAKVDAFVDIKREEMYALVKRKLVPLYKYAKIL